MTLVKNLFPSQNKQDTFFNPVNSKIPKNHLSIRYHNYFDRYFDYSFTGRLSDVDFENASSGDKDDFIKILTLWANSDNVGNEIIDALERKKQYDTVEEFDKIVSGIVLMYKIKGINNKFAQKIDLKKFIDRFLLT